MGGEARPMLWRCGDCGWKGQSAEMLEAKHPFRSHETVVGCPDCGAMDEFENLCDEPGCSKEAGCGFPTPDGYRRTCYEHMKAAEKAQGADDGR